MGSVRVQAYDDTGARSTTSRADTSAFHVATGVRGHRGTVWTGRVEESAVAVLNLSGSAD